MNTDYLCRDAINRVSTWFDPNRENPFNPCNEVPCPNLSLTFA